MVSAVIKGVYRQPRERAPHPGEGSGRVPGEGLGLECLGRPEEATRAAEARGGGGGTTPAVVWCAGRMANTFPKQSLPLHNAGRTWMYFSDQKEDSREGPERCRAWEDYTFGSVREGNKARDRMVKHAIGHCMPCSQLMLRT